jgi:hypothetical protein
MLSNHRIVGVVIGVLEFVATHLILVAKWTTWFHGAYEPWFLNSGSAGAFTGACLFVGSLVAGLFDISGVFVWVGAVAAMTLVLVIPPGPGTLWPIVMALGGVMLAVPILGGNMLGFGIRYVVAKSRSTRLAGR